MLVYGYCVILNAIWLCTCVGDDPSKLAGSTQPKLTLLLHAHQGLVCWCMIVLLFGCGICVGNYPSKLGVSTQPKLSLLHLLHPHKSRAGTAPSSTLL